MSTKEFFLHSKTISQGRDAITNFVTAHLASAPSHFPVGTPGLFSTFIANVELAAQEYLKHAEKGKYHSAVFDRAVSAASWATVAAELAVEFCWVSRVSYAPSEQEQNVLTQAQRGFARDVNRLLNVLHELCRDLRDSDNDDSERDSQERVHLHRRQRLQQALYLAELAVRITCPENYAYHHPDAHKWLNMRASVRRKLAHELVASADLDDAVAHTYRGNVRN